MIEINLIPDVKRELIRAHRLRTTVTSMSILIGIVAIGIVVVMTLYIFGAQTLRSSLADSSIKSQQEKLQKTEGLTSALTIQKQVSVLSGLSKDRQADSRIFDVLATIIPAAPNTVAITKTAVDTESKTITIDAQADSGFAALEVFRKTISGTNIEYMDGTVSRKIALAENISDSDRSYGEDASGKKVLRFTISFTYPTELFARSTDARVVGPGKANATDSFIAVPNSLFTSRASDSRGDQ